MLLLSRKDIQRVFTMRDAIEADKLAFRMLAEGAVEVPLRINIQAPQADGTFLFMPAYAESLEAASLKIINVFPRNPEKGLPACPAQVLLINGKTGETAAVLDGNTVTQYRTGAASGAAFDLLAKKECRVGALIGTGGQAPAQLEAMLTARRLSLVKIYDMDRQRCGDFTARMSRELAAYGVPFEAAGSSDEAVEEADLIITVTPSETPVFDGSKVKEGAVVSAVGAYQPHMQELPPELLARAAGIYFDSREAVLAESGDILKPLAEGTITEADFTGDLGELILGKIPGRRDDHEILVFETVGVAVQDLVAAKKIYEKAAACGAGTVWESGN